MIYAPWTPETVAGLNTFQASGTFRPLTCSTPGCKAILLATENGWVCPEQCGYTRTMAEDWMPLVCSTAEEVAVQRLKDILTTRGYGAVVQEMMQLAKDNDELRFELTVLKEKMAIRGRGRPPKRKK